MHAFADDDCGVLLARVDQTEGTVYLRCLSQNLDDEERTGVSRHVILDRISRHVSGDGWRLDVGQIIVLTFVQKTSTKQASSMGLDAVFSHGRGTHDC